MKKATKLKKCNKIHLKKGLKVQVIAGNNNGKTGEITKVIVDKQRAIVAGINMVKRHIKPTAKNPQGGIITKEASIHVSNLMVIDPKNNKPTRIGRKLNEQGKLQRYSKKTGEFI